jgi:hypothetical protein
MVVQNSGMEGKIEELGPALLEAFLVVIKT